MTAHSIEDPRVRKAVLDLIEAAHPDTDAVIRSVRALLINKAILDDRLTGVIYTGVAIGVLMRLAVESPDAKEVLDKYKATVEAYERGARGGDQ